MIYRLIKKEEESKYKKGVIREKAMMLLISKYPYHHHQQLSLLLLLLLPLFLFSLQISTTAASASPTKQSYIVYLGSHNSYGRYGSGGGGELTTTLLHQLKESHYEFLASFLGSKAHAKEAIIYHYKRHINGFAAMLDQDAAAQISKHPEVVSVFLNKGRKLHTTHSWNFLSLEKRNGVIYSGSLWEKARFGEDSIIGNLDTGVWPESKSFSNYNGIGPIPSRWKGRCQNDATHGVHCNRKLIGARYFNKGWGAYGGKLNSSLDTARDTEGHGTHTLSTAGGNFVHGANIFGIGNGTAKGGSPKARVAAYKVCWTPLQGNECFDADIIKGFEMAIEDGVDVLSVSLGGDPDDYFSDGIAIGAFHAVTNGIVVVCSAGNSGPTPATVSNLAPWIITVGASTIDREFQTFVELNNGQRLKGMSLSKPLPEHKLYPLITGQQAKAATAPIEDAILCKGGSLDPKKVKGKILVCLRGVNARVDKGQQAALAGAVGMILCNDKAGGNAIVSDPHLLPASHINYKDGLEVYAYINSTNEPTGFITAPEEALNTKPAPFMASFSSRGPNIITPGILKPDITAPGVNIIAAYSEGTSPTGEVFDKRKVPFITESGTSMSCPHISGVVGLLKTLHPNWSPAAIRSAMMTTARTRDNRRRPIVDGSLIEATPFSYGAGHVRPNRAMDPGLVYDLTVNNYLDFLCAIGYNETMIQRFSDAPYKCRHHNTKSINPLHDFNYPSITVPTKISLHSSATVSRKLKNVGTPGTYVAHVRNPYGFSVSVKPRTLRFKRINQEKSFKLTLKRKKNRSSMINNNSTSARHVTDGYVFGQLLWSDGKHYVRSPIVVVV